MREDYTPISDSEMFQWMHDQARFAGSGSRRRRRRSDEGLSGDRPKSNTTRSSTLGDSWCRMSSKGSCPKARSDNVQHAEILIPDQSDEESLSNLESVPGILRTTRRRLFLRWGSGNDMDLRAAVHLLDQLAVRVGAIPVGGELPRALRQQRWSLPQRPSEI